MSEAESIQDKRSFGMLRRVEW